MVGRGEARVKPFTNMVGISSPSIGKTVAGGEPGRHAGVTQLVDGKTQRAELVLTAGDEIVACRGASALVVDGS